MKLLPIEIIPGLYRGPVLNAFVNKTYTILRGNFRMTAPGLDNLAYLNALNCLPFLGPRRITAMIRYFRTAKRAWEAPEQDLQKVEGLSGFVSRIIEARAKIDPHLEWNRIEEHGVKCAGVDSLEYPALLRELPCPPPVLYYRGVLNTDRSLSIAIVGSRRSTFYGKEVAHRLAGELAAAGVDIVSGMALGIDTAAHRGCLENSGYTVAVLGCGLDCCYPPANADLMEQIASSGAVVSEFPLGTKPMPGHFPQRNRIISGMTLGTVVVEATAKSGSLITADLALEQNREVFAVPGNIGSPYSRGCHQLIKEGAHLVESAADILKEIMFEQAAGSREEQLTITSSGSSLTEAEKALLGAIPYQPMHIDDIVRSVEGTASEVITTLLALELKQVIRQTPGKFFCRI